tara:strand:- start:1552 stop:1941 length:390 start_codon:yes stop_codon:yes gene_type:complete
MQILAPLALLVALPTIASLLPVRVLNWRWGHALLVAFSLCLALMVTANAYHIGNSYKGFPCPSNWGLFVFGVAWSALFCVPLVLVIRSVSGRDKKDVRHDLLRGLVGSFFMAVFMALPSVILIVLLSLE